MALHLVVDLPSMELGELAPGDRVFVIANGVGVVSGRERMEVGEGVMFQLANKQVAFPLDRPCVCVRPLIDRARAQAVLELLATTTRARDDRSWEERYQDCETALFGGEPEAVARGLMMLEGRPAPRSFGERQLLRVMAAVLFDELAAVLETTEDDIRARAAFR